MNPLVTQQLREIAQALDALKKEWPKVEQRISQAENARDDLRQQMWSQSKELNVLRERMDDLPQLIDENERFRTMADDFEQRLMAIMGMARALQAELRP